MQTVHKHYQMGQAPYRFIAVWSAPSKSLQEANPAAYNVQMNNRPKVCRFACDHCGAGIEHHYIIRDANGSEFCVGSTCIDKVGAVLNLSDAEAAERKRQKELRQARAEAKREAKRIAREAELDAQRERNGGLTDRELAEQNRREQIRLEREANLNRFEYFISHLLSDGGYFAKDLATSLKEGRQLYGRGVDIMLDIIAKSAGRRNSKAYNAKLEEATIKWGQAA